MIGLMEKQEEKDDHTYKILRDQYFSVAKMSTKIVTLDKGAEIKNLEESLLYYKKINESIEAMKEQDDTTKEMRKICTEMCNLLPIQIKEVASRS